MLAKQFNGSANQKKNSLFVNLWHNTLEMRTEQTIERIELSYQIELVQSAAFY